MSQAAQHRPAALLETAALSGEEAAALTRVYTGQRRYLRAADRAALDRLLGPVETITAGWRRTHGAAARNGVLAAVHHTQSGYWAWDEDTWAGLVASTRGDLCHAYQVIAIGYLLGGQHRLHHRFTDVRVRKLADLVFGPASVQPAVDEVSSTLHGWQVSPRTPSDQIEAATIDVLLTCGSPHLTDVTEDGFTAALNASRSVPFRRQGLFKVSRVLADKGLIAAPLTSNHDKRGPKPATLATVPGPWLAWVLRWRRLCTNEPATVASMFSVILIAGRWAAAKHPEAITPPDWNRDLAAEYVADTMQATVGQWASHPGTKTRLGQPLTAAGKANRLDGLRSFFCDLIEWEWITPRFDPRRVLSLPGPLRAQLEPNPRIIDDAAWAKLMAAGLTLTDADLTPDMAPARDPSPHAAGRRRKRYPVEMTRALVGAWLFAGCRIDELSRLELDCVVWDQGHDEHTGRAYPICLLRVPQNKTSGPFSKPVDPLVGDLIDAWKQVRPAQPDLADRKTGLRRQHLFCHRGQLVGDAYLNTTLIPLLCRKAGIPEADSRGALTSHRARATIATQLLNAREPLSLADLQQWLGHKHPASTRHYAAILQRTLAAAYKKADYFARNVRTIEVLIDRETILNGAAADGQPWKYYDLGEGYCTYDFFAKCPHRLACARCPFYLPKQSHAGQLLAVKDGIEQMLEQIDLTDEEREALQGDRDAVAALAQRLADVPTPAGPTPSQLGTSSAFISLTTLRDSLPVGQP
jgi:integrase